MGKAILFKGIDRELQKEFKTACAFYDISMKGSLIKHMQKIINDYRKERMMFDKPKIYKNRKGKK